jgi:hypothetical protein
MILELAIVSTVFVHGSDVTQVFHGSAIHALWPGWKKII